MTERGSYFPLTARACCQQSLLKPIRRSPVKNANKKMLVAISALTLSSMVSAQLEEVLVSAQKREQEPTGCAHCYQCSQ
jgi:hypothetical protein